MKCETCGVYSVTGAKCINCEKPRGKEFPYSLTCTGCDAGAGIDSYAAARVLGWVDITYDDGPSWNFLGTCPQCMIEDSKIIGGAAGATQ